MEIYLPIAELSVNVLVMLAMGIAIGFISGLFGVGGGFLLTPLLIFTGIPSGVAVATVTPQIVASSTSAAVTYWRRGAIDFRLAGVLFLSGAIGSVAGAYLFAELRSSGHLDLVIAISYTIFLGAIGGLMLNESARALMRSNRRRLTGAARAAERRAGEHKWIHKLPLKIRFRQSRLYISVLPIAGLGISIAFLGTLLGIGGGFIMVPALIYLLRVPTSIVVGTSLVQIVGTMAVATVMHSIASHTVDAVLGLILMVGGVMGAQFGASMGLMLRAEQLRLLLALLVLGVGVRFAVDLTLEPANPYSFTEIGIPGGRR